MNFLCQVHVYESCTLCSLETACTVCTPNILSMFTYFSGNIDTNYCKQKPEQCFNM